MDSITRVEGRAYGPFQFSVTPSNRKLFLEATSDNPDHWITVSPPGFAAAALFLTAPEFFADPDVLAYATGVVHADQTFTWHKPWRDGTHHASGVVKRVRERGGVFFITLTTRVVDSSERLVVESTSTFLMSRGATTDQAVEVAEPLANQKAVSEIPGAEPKVTMAKSASRSDLIRYAAATRDFNEIHWDHDSALAAGLPAVVVHGLLLANWMFQAAASYGRGDQPLIFAKVRFKAFVLPAEQCQVESSISEDGDTVSVTLSVDESVRATMSARVTQ